MRTTPGPWNPSKPPSWRHREYPILTAARPKPENALFRLCLGFHQHVPRTMPDPHSPDSEPRPRRSIGKRLIDRLTGFLRPAPPADRKDLKAVIDAAHRQSVLDGESYAMMSGALDVADKIVSDIMVPRSR